jgi:FtsP/CotA-like multicopper oxidase with cupredoxin domain
MFLGGTRLARPQSVMTCALPAVFRTCLAPIAVLSLSSFGCAGASPSGHKPAEQSSNLGLAEATDLDPNPDVVSVVVRAAPEAFELLPGKTTPLMAYGGRVPGPLIHAKRGDLLQVHFENALTEPTTIHFHGIRVPNAMDGVPDMTQPSVAPGSTFDYSFQLPDAGLYWYHPHCDTLSEMGAGLYGAILVDDPDEPQDLGDETVLVLSDVSLDASGALVPPATDPADIVAGSDGNVVLVNGRIHPELAVEQGHRQRLRVLNAARARYFSLSFAGHSFLQIGSDGGRLEQPASVQNPVLAPGERVDLLLEPEGDVGSSLELVALPYARGLSLPASNEEPLVTFKIVPAETAPSPPLPAITRALTPIDTTGAEQVTIALTIDEEASSVTMGINGVPGSEAQPLHATVGTTQILDVQNMTPYAHPFHLHGFFFQPLDQNGAPVHPLMDRDTFNVPPETAVKLAVTYDDRPGTWMFHCHILDHAEAGMMGMIHVMQ